MKAYPTEKIRNLVLLGHGGTGKTSFAEAALFVSGAINRLGRVDDGTTTSDFDPDEVRRKVSINASLLPLEWQDRKINLIDAPGYADFIGDAYSGLAAADAAVIVVCAASGVQVGTDLAWRMAAERRLPRAVVINRLDRENANFAETLRQVQSQLSKKCVAVHLPIGSQEYFQGIVDLVDQKAYLGEKGTEAAPPAELAGEIEAARGQLLEAVAENDEDLPNKNPEGGEAGGGGIGQVLEAVAENDEDLLNKYLEGEELSVEDIGRGLAAGVASGDLIPGFAASAAKTIGVARFLDAVARYFPSPLQASVKTADGADLPADAAGPLAAQVFKTTADPYVGKLTYLRVFSGTLKADTHVWNAN